MKKSNQKLKVLVAGINGIIGSAINEEFKNCYELYGITSRKNSNGALEIDLRERQFIISKIQNLPSLDILIFLTGLAHKKGIKSHINNFRDFNKQTLVNLLHALEEVDNIPNKIIFASSISVYGENILTDTYNEDSFTNPQSPYGVTKLEAEKFLLNKYKNISWVLRFSPVYSDYFMLNIKRRTQLGNLFFMVGNGEQQLSLCNMKNITYIIKSIIDDYCPPGVYNLSDNVKYTYRDLLGLNKSKMIIKIPRVFIWITFKINKFFLNNNYIHESCIKLFSNNLYPSTKIGKHFKIPYNLFTFSNAK